jgi:hypothetical protein
MSGMLEDQKGIINMPIIQNRFKINGTIGQTRTLMKAHGNISELGPRGRHILFETVRLLFLDYFF